MKKFTHLFFDLDNTIWDFKSNSKDAMETAFTQLNIAQQNILFADFIESYNQNNEELWSAYRAKRLKKRDLIYQRFEKTFQDLSISGINPSEMNDCYLTEMPKQTRLMKGAWNILHYAKSKGYKLNIITNGFRDVQYKKIETSGLTGFFDKIFISEEIKTPKPGKEIFEHALKSSNATKSKSLMIGDDWEGDILGATRFGIRSIYFNTSPLKQHMEIKEKEARYLLGKITHLSELEQWL